MSVNKLRPHLLVLPEDDANRQIANEFQSEVDWKRKRQMQVLGPARGWCAVIELLTSQHVPEMRRQRERMVLLLIDFDCHEGRLRDVKAAIPEDLTGRVFVLGSWSKPEKLTGDLGSYETIGKALARDCRDGTDTTWSHALLRHNANEVARLLELVRPILLEDH